MLKLYDNFPNGLTRIHSHVRLKSRLQGKPLPAQQRCQLACLGELGCRAQNVSVVGPSLARQEGQQGEDTRVSSPAKGQRRELVNAPTEAADNVTRVGFYREKRVIQCASTHGIV